MLWSLASRRAKRISCPKKFRSSAGKDFFNNIGTNRTNRAGWMMSVVRGIVLQNSFWITEDKFSGLWARRSNNRAGDHSNKL
jgi:hypothetical protein